MKRTVLFLCTGNICRSPLAEALARARWPQSPAAFASAGLEAPSGHPASGGSVLFARSRGADLTAHRSRPVTGEVLADCAWVVGMTRGHAARFRSRWGAAYAGRLGILGAPGLDLMREVFSPEAEEVADPYGQDDEVYRRTGEQILRLLDGWRDVFAGGPPDGKEEA